MYHKSQEEKELILKLMGEVYDNKFWSLGERTKEAERLCKEKIFHGQKEVLMTNDGTHALDLCYRDWETDRKSTRLNSSHSGESRMPSSA